MFLGFNRRFWDGALPTDTQVLWMPLPNDRVAETERLEGGRFVIRLSPSIAGFPRYYRLILIHEMCHVHLWGRRIAWHGKVWKGELLRVLAAGAARWV